MEALSYSILMELTRRALFGLLPLAAAAPATALAKPTIETDMLLYRFAWDRDAL